MINQNGKYQIELLLTAVLTVAVCSTTFAQTAPPPNLGEDTKGQPAATEATAESSETTEPAPTTDDVTTSQANAEKTTKSGIGLGTATVKESRRENGQVYLIELEHSSGAKQYIEETDSDGTIESVSDGVDETPNLPKWKLGSW